MRQIKSILSNAMPLLFQHQNPISLVIFIPPWFSSWWCPVSYTTHATTQTHFECKGAEKDEEREKTFPPASGLLDQSGGIILEASSSGHGKGELFCPLPGHLAGLREHTFHPQLWTVPHYYRWYLENILKSQINFPTVTFTPTLDSYLSVFDSTGQFQATPSQMFRSRSIIQRNSGGLFSWWFNSM